MAHLKKRGRGRPPAPRLTVHDDLVRRVYASDLTYHQIGAAINCGVRLAHLLGTADSPDGRVPATVKRRAHLLAIAQVVEYHGPLFEDVLS